MDEIRIRDKEELTILDIREITEKRLMEFFLDKLRQVVYITDDKKNINAISVIDKSNRILKEYYRDCKDIKLKNNKISFNIVKQIYYKINKSVYN